MNQAWGRDEACAALLIPRGRVPVVPFPLFVGGQKGRPKPRLPSVRKSIPTNSEMVFKFGFTNKTVVFVSKR